MAILADVAADVALGKLSQARRKLWETLRAKRRTHYSCRV